MVVNIVTATLMNERFRFVSRIIGDECDDVDEALGKWRLTVHIVFEQIFVDEHLFIYGIVHRRFSVD
ncbi:hypothetical protein BG842_03780 [Haladaptatus sp. W1]|nr:hypothetical protein BG842_03780 [Haladaptatus sp. W1]